MLKKIFSPGLWFKKKINTERKTKIKFAEPEKEVKVFYKTEEESCYVKKSKERRYKSYAIIHLVKVLFC